MDLAALSRDERRRLAQDETTNPEVLAELASDVFLVPLLVENPATPDAALQEIYRGFPHLRPHGVADSSLEPGVDSAIANFRRRQATTTRPYAPAASRPATSREQYVQAVDATGRTVHVPVSSFRHRSTNGLAIASFILALVGGSVLAVILGHVAKAQIAARGEAGEGLATAGLIIGYASLAVLAVFGIFVVR